MSKTPTPNLPHLLAQNKVFTASLMLAPSHRQTETMQCMTDSPPGYTHLCVSDDVGTHSKAKMPACMSFNAVH